jgi:hypothetical protein
MGAGSFVLGGCGPDGSARGPQWVFVVCFAVAAAAASLP